MKLILFSKGRAAARHVEFSVPLVVACLIGFMALSIGGVGYLFARALDRQQPIADVDHMKSDLAAQQKSLDEIKDSAQKQIDALTIRMGELNASAIRLNALGRRLTDMADLDEGEFDFENPPAVGGPVESEMPRTTGQAADFFADINTMDRRLHDQQQQLMVLEGLLLNRRLNDRFYPK